MQLSHVPTPSLPRRHALARTLVRTLALAISLVVGITSTSACAEAGARAAPDDGLERSSEHAASEPSTRALLFLAPPRIRCVPLGSGAADASLLDAGVLGDDAGMTPPLSPSERFSITPAQTRVEVHAGDRFTLPITLTRADGHDAYVELKASGLPPHVVAVAAFGVTPSQLALVFEAGGLASVASDRPFVIEAHADGVRVSQRLLLTILPERMIPEE